MLHRKIIYLSCIASLFIGCAQQNIRVMPDINLLNETVRPLECKIHYDGSNKEYLPRLLQDSKESQIGASYQYDVRYINGNTDWDGLNIWNPLLIVGFPMSEESVIVEAKCELKDKEIVVKTFEASCIANKTRNLFQNSGSSEPRKACLLAVRDNIDQQIKHYQKESLHE